MFKILSRLFAPYLMKYASKKMGEKFEKQYKAQQQYKRNAPQYKEGETVIDKKPHSSNSNSSNKVGEYIEFEEIE